MTTEQKTSAHTPGPWEAEDVRHENRITVRTVDGLWPIAAVHVSSTRSKYMPDAGASNPEHVANARLIAAAPDLLELCETVIEFLDNGTPIRPGCVLANDIREAIHKARGT